MELRTCRAFVGAEAMAELDNKLGHIACRDRQRIRAVSETTWSEKPEVKQGPHNANVHLLPKNIKRAKRANNKWDEYCNILLGRCCEQLF